MLNGPGTLDKPRWLNEETFLNFLKQTQFVAIAQRGPNVRWTRAYISQASFNDFSRQPADSNGDSRLDLEAI